MKPRVVVETLQARASSDGAGVKLYRVFGGHHLERFDPFLLLDDFGSDQPEDYLAGFPPHPHRGFRTVTYMLEGEFEHRDHLGHVGAIHSGGVQWMTAGRGVIHSEMPIQQAGRIRGFQLWLNLPSEQKMMAPSYENVEAEEIPTYQIDGVEVKAIAGQGVLNGVPLYGQQQIPQTEPLYLALYNDQQQSQVMMLPIATGNTLLVYLVQGKVNVNGKDYAHGQLLRFGETGHLGLTLGPDSRVLVLGGKPLREPIAQYGPFVMNTQAELDLAVSEYQKGTLTEPASGAASR